VHHYLDLNTMQTRTHDGYYSDPEQFYADCCTIQHNIYVCFGGNGATLLTNVYSLDDDIDSAWHVISDDVDVG